MESIEQPFDSIGHMGQEVMDTADKSGLIEKEDKQKVHNGDSPRAENSPLHQAKSTNSILHSPQNQGLRVIIISSVVFAIGVTVALILTIYLEPRQVHGHAAVACDDVRCSEIGLNILRDGGNAVDAAVATAFCLGVVNPAHSGLGGGGFALVHDNKYKRSWAYNFQEQAPAATTPDMLDIASPEMSVLSTGVPGFLKGLAEMHTNHGHLPWKDVVEPSILLAKDFYVSDLLVKSVFPKLSAESLQGTELGKMLLTRAGTFKDANDNITRLDLAATLKLVGADKDALYTGALSEKFIEEVGLVGGKISLEDMKNYTVSKPEVIKFKFKELTVVGLPPPSSGPLLALILNMVDSLGWKVKERNDALRYHQLIETFKFAFAHQGLLGDPNFNTSMNQVTNTLISQAFAKQLVDKMDNNTYTDPDHYGPFQPISNKGTSHLSIIDSSELMVAATLSINSAFGNQILLPKTGIILNNELMNFDLTGTNKANQMESKKRPLSSIIPTVLYNDQHPCAQRMVIGGSNGTRIITGVAESIINTVLFKMNISQAIAAPRIHNQLVPSATEYEGGFPASIANNLTGQFGHVLREAAEGMGAVQAIEKTNDAIDAFSDGRAYSEAAEY